MNTNSSTKQLLVPFIYLTLFFSVYYALTNDTVYRATLSYVLHPYRSYIDKDGGYRADVPYIPIEKDRLKNWDASFYEKIGKHGYTEHVLDAFFPLFPLLFKLTGFSWLIIVVNFLLFSLSLRYLFNKLANTALRHSWIMLLLLISMPTVIVFLIPYSEALFFFCFTIFIAGFFKGNKYLLFAGLFLAAATRPIVTIVLLSFLAVEFIRFLQTRNIKCTLNSILLFLPPILIGTFFAVYTQYLYTGSFLNFISVQKDVWEHTFRLPTRIADWSAEGHVLNMFAVLFVVIPCLVSCYRIFLKALKQQSKLFSVGYILQSSFDEKVRYLNILSAAYVVGSFLFILFFQGGSLNGMFRYIMCSPFFYIFLIDKINKVYLGEITTKNALYTVLGLTAAFVAWVGAHGERLPNTIELPFLLMVCAALVFILHSKMTKRMLLLCTLLIAFAGLVYQTYLFNSFLANSWILT